MKDTPKEPSRAAARFRYLKILLPALLVLFLAILFRAQIGELIKPGPDDTSNVVKIGPNGLSVARQRRSIELITEEIYKAGAEAGHSPEQIAASVERVTAALRDRVRSGGGAAAVLWVDDHPENNDGLIDAFKTAGVAVAIARSNAEARAAVRGGNFRVVITDIGRDNETETGMDFANDLYRSGVPTPLVVYTSDQTAQEALNNARLARYKITSDPGVLYEYVLDATGVGAQRSN